MIITTTTDLDNYITYIKNTNKKRKFSEDDLRYELINEAIDIIMNDIPNETIDIISNKCEDYKENKHIIKEDKYMDKERKLYNQALYSLMIKIINDYLSSDMEENFNEYLLNIQDSLFGNVSMKKSKMVPIATFPLETFLTMLSSLNKFPGVDMQNDNDDNIKEDPDYEPSTQSDDSEIQPIKSTFKSRIHDKNKNKVKSKTHKEFIKEVFKNVGTDNDEKEIAKYYSKLTNTEQNDLYSKLVEINNYKKVDKPKLVEIMAFPIPVSQKNYIMKQYITLINSHHPDNKLRTWVDAVLSFPFGKYKGIDLKNINSQDQIQSFLTNLETIMDSAVWGHNDAKRQIIQMMGQQIRNSESKGNVLGIWGPPGNGKTTLIKEGIAKAMDKPFVFISLGGATDASFLEGHSYTYEGSIYGRIANGIINSGCMNPIIYFDELDKISRTPKGEEISNILVHLTDPAQNSHFRDKYFHGIDIDLSRATIIFSFNNIANVNPILLDRITTIETKYLMKPQKIHIAQNYLLPVILKETGLKNDDIKINNKIISKLIEKYTREGGVRKLKSLLYNIVREVNLANLMNTDILDSKINFPIRLTKKHINVFMKSKLPIQPEKIHNEPKVGFITGMYAGSLGVGGILPIQIVWVPSHNPMTLKATGNLKKVIKESTEVATSLAWNHLDSQLQTDYLAAWKAKPQGFHIHCPDGAIPKDGPSAGTALTVALYSILLNKKIRNDIAITGEITLDGKVTAIGGLEEKLVGAKKAGVKLALIPKENELHLEKVKERNLTLLDNNFNVITIETLDDALKYSLVY
jgi:ATP-dependent Lon protease